MSEFIPQFLVLAGVIVTSLPAYFKVLKPLRQENARDHAVVAERLASLVEGQARAKTWMEQHDLRHEDLQDRLQDLTRQT